MIDYLIIVLIAFAAIFGLFRGIISQIMALAGLVAAYYLAPDWGHSLAPYVQRHLGCSKFIAEKASILLIGVGIYLCLRLVGFVFEKLFVEHVGEFKSLNRFGGAVLGALKGMIFVAIIFFFIALVPQSVVKAWIPKLPESQVYKWAAKYNPMGKQVVLERMRQFRTTASDTKKIDQMRKSVQLEKLFEKYELKNALRDERFVKSVQEGDYGELQKNEQIEKLMQDDQLTKLLEDLNREAPPKT